MSHGTHCVLTALTVAVFVLVAAIRVHAGDELEHRHLVFAVARAIGYSEKEAEIISAASWSMDQNEGTDAMPSDNEKKKLTAALANGDPVEKLLYNGYYARGFLFHALGSEESRALMKSYYQKQMDAPNLPADQRLVRAGMFMHYLVDSYVHPNQPIYGHLPAGHKPDYAVNHPDKYKNATKEMYTRLRALYTEMHPEVRASQAKRESRFDINIADKEHGLDRFADKVVNAIASAYPQSASSVADVPGVQRTLLWSTDVPRLTVNAKTNLRDAFADSFRQVGETALAVPEYRRIAFERGSDGRLHFERRGSIERASVSDPLSVCRRTSVDELSKVRSELVGYDRFETDIGRAAKHVAKPVMGLTTGVDNSVRRMTGFPNSNGPAPSILEVAGDQTIRLTAPAQKRMQEFTERENLGGVNLDVMIDFLSMLGTPACRPGHPARCVNDPVLVSLKNVLARIQHARGGTTEWPTDAESLNLGGLTRICGYTVDPVRSDIILIGETEPGTPVIGLENFVVGVRDVYVKSQTPAVSLDPNLADVGGPQYSRVLGIARDTAFAKVLLDADYKMKRIMLGEDTVNLPGFRSQASMMRDDPDRDSGRNRWWFYPVRFGRQDIRTSHAGDITLFDTQLQLLTESLSMSESGVVGLGHPDPLVERATRLFTQFLPQLEENVRWNDQLIFKQLHGLLDVTTLCTLWRTQLLQKPELLVALANLPVPTREVPRFYAGLTREIAQRVEGNRLHTFLVQGGVELARRIYRRHLDSYDDPSLRLIRNAARKLANGDISVNADAAILICESTAEKQEAAYQSLQAGIMRAAENQLERALQDYGRAINTMPDMIEAYVLRAVVEIRLKQFAAAKEDLNEAQRLAPTDPDIRATQLWLVLESGDAGSFGSYPYTARIAARDHMQMEGDRLLLNNKIEESIDRFSKALALNQDLEQGAHFRLLVSRGNAYEVVKDYSKSKQDYAEAAQLYKHIARFDSLTAQTISDSYHQLQLGKARLEVLLGNYEQSLSENSILYPLTQHNDPAVRLEALYHWTALKAFALKQQRQERINAGHGISKSWSSYEMSGLDGLAEALQDEVVRDRKQAAGRAVVTELAQMAEKLIAIIKKRSADIERHELNQ